MDKKLHPVALVWHQLFYWEKPGYVDHRTVGDLVGIVPGWGWGWTWVGPTGGSDPLVDDARLLPETIYKKIQ